MAKLNERREQESIADYYRKQEQLAQLQDQHKRDEEKARRMKYLKDLN
jgi:hypothetical protein